MIRLMICKCADVCKGLRPKQRKIAVKSLANARQYFHEFLMILYEHIKAYFMRCAWGMLDIRVRAGFIIRRAHARDQYSGLSSTKKQ